MKSMSSNITDLSLVTPITPIPLNTLTLVIYSRSHTTYSARELLACQSPETISLLLRPISLFSPLHQVHLPLTFLLCLFLLFFQPSLLPLLSLARFRLRRCQLYRSFGLHRLKQSLSNVATQYMYTFMRFVKQVVNDNVRTLNC